MGWWGLTPAGTAVLQPLAGLLLSPDPAGPLLDASAPGPLPVPEGVLQCSVGGIRPWVILLTPEASRHSASWLLHHRVLQAPPGTLDLPDTCFVSSQCGSRGLQGPFLPPSTLFNSVLEQILVSFLFQEALQVNHPVAADISGTVPSL